MHFDVDVNVDVHLDVHFDTDLDVDLDVDVNLSMDVVHLNVIPDVDLDVDFAGVYNTRMGLKYFSSLMNMGSYHLHLPAITTVLYGSMKTVPSSEDCPRNTTLLNEPPGSIAITYSMILLQKEL